MYQKCSQSWIKHFDFMVLDLICLQLAYFAAFVLRNGWENPYKSELYRNMAVVIILIGICVLEFFGTLKNVLKRNSTQEFIFTLRNAIIVVILASFYLFIIQQGDKYSRVILILTGTIYAGLSYIVRLAWKKRLITVRKKNRKRSLLIVTVDSMVNDVVRNIQDNSYEMFHIAGIAVINKDLIGKAEQGIKIVANKDTVLDYVCREWVDEVFINIPQSEPYPEILIDKFNEMGVTVHIELAKYHSENEKKQLVERIGAYTVLTTSINYATAPQLFVKRLLDVIGGFLGCIITGIIFVFIAPAIYSQSPGPIFFSQIRVGKNGKKFKLYKFRSMYLDAEERKKELMEQNTIKDGMMFKIPYDNRIIGCKKLEDGTVIKGIGNIIRDLSLDEFPQFFNVLRGDMSLVGTRPPTLDEWEKYDLHQRARLAIKPGITGMWQVNGRSNIKDFEEVVRLDKQYIINWSLKLDIKIILKTFCVVFRRDGSM